MERDNAMLKNIHRLAYEWHQEKGREIYNATIGGQLEEYPRVEFDKLF